MAFIWKSIKLVGCINLYFTLLLFSSVSFSEGSRVVILGAKKTLSYKSVIRGFKNTLQGSTSDVSFVDADSNNKVLPDLAFSLGKKGISLWRESMSDVDMLATLITHDKSLLGKDNVTTVKLSRPPLAYLQWVKKIMPNVRTVGVLYDPKNNSKWIEQAKKDAKKLGLKMVSISVTSVKNLGSSLKLIGRKADVILGINDKTVYSGKTAQKILLFSYNNRIPFVGASGAWAKAGALFALDWDYEALGEQSAKLVLKKLKGENPKSELAKKTTYRVNLKTAKQLKLTLSQTVLDNAAKVYQ